jgi:DNA-binding LytR/AlgR family response regulator
VIDFVLIEDNKLQIVKTKEIINSFMFEKSVEYHIFEFYDYDIEFKKFVDKSDKYKIYIIDFELPSGNAIDIARKIREKDWESSIIILSIYGGMAYETFKQRLQILDFVNKQYEEEKNLKELFNICLKQYDNKKFLAFRSNNVDYRIDINKVLCIYRNGNRKSVVVTDLGEYETYMSLKKLNERISNKLTKTHKACFVNIDRVIKIDWKSKIIKFDIGLECRLLSNKQKKEISHEY